MARVAFIGLGNMGGGMAANLAKAGHDVRAFDLSQEALDRAKARGCPVVLGTATKAYKPIQNRELMQLLAPISAQNDWTVETVGVLGRGERVFLTLDAGQVEVPGDTSGVNMFFFVTAGHDGGSAVKIGVTPVRIVCQNTLLMGLSAATISAAVTHTGDALGNVEFNVDAIAQMHSAKSAVEAAMRLLAAAPASPQGIDTILTAAYPVPDPSTAATRAATFLASTVTLTPERRLILEGQVKKSEQWISIVKEYRKAAEGRLTVFNDEYPAIANTPWAVANAVAETEQYRKSKTDAVASADFMFGGRGKSVAAAFGAAMLVAG